MNLRVRTPLPWLLSQVARLRRTRRERRLKRLLEDQSTQQHWRRRQASQARQFWFVARSYRLQLQVANYRDYLQLFLGALPALLQSFGFGAFLVLGVLAIEAVGSRYIIPAVLLPEDSPFPLSSFPVIATQVSASLLGFYLASVSIVLGQSYYRVSSGVRDLVLNNARTRFYLRTIGVAIGAGLTLVLLRSIDLSYGYLVVFSYSLLVIFAGWPFTQLALGAFNLFSPIAIAEEPLRRLYRAINHLGSKGLSGDEAVLRANAQSANKALLVLAELVDETRNRAFADRDGLVRMVEHLMVGVHFYSIKKHLIAPTSEWFLREPAYPKWVEADYSTTKMALQASTPLPPRMKTQNDWLEIRTAELASVALKFCIAENDTTAALRIARGAADTAKALAKGYHVDESVRFSKIIRDSCWSIQSQGEASAVLSAEPPYTLTALLLGCLEAIKSWKTEIDNAVRTTKWNRNTAFVRIRGPLQVRIAAQRLLKEIHAEEEIEGHCSTPDWYLRSVLASQCLQFLREFARTLPELIANFTLPQNPQLLPETKAMLGGQGLQTIAKGELLGDTILEFDRDLESLLLQGDQEKGDDFANLSDALRECRAAILGQLSEVIKELQPEQSTSKPDLFGQVYSALMHHAANAIEEGDTECVERLFPGIIEATRTLNEYVQSTYVPPKYRFTSMNLDPLIHLLELSGIALIYESIRGDQSAASVRQAWQAWIQSSDEPIAKAKWLLNVLDFKDGRFWWNITPRDMEHTDWEIRLVNRVVEAGYARPEAMPFATPPVWNAPPLLKMLGVSEWMRHVSLNPRTLFAGEVIAPMSDEPEEVLRERPGIQDYYSEQDLQSRRDAGSQDIEEDDDGDEWWVKERGLE